MINGFLSIIGSIIAIGAIFKEDCKRNDDTHNNRYDAKINKKQVYYDGNNYLRATSTNEKVHPTYCSGGHTKYIGIKSGTIYHDTLNDINRRMVGKRYIYKEYPNGSYSTKLWKFDLKEQMPYTERMLPSDLKDWRPAIELCYYPELKKDGSVDTLNKRIIKKIYMTDEEYQYYRLD